LKGATGETIFRGSNCLFHPFPFQSSIHFDRLSIDLGADLCVIGKYMKKLLCFAVFLLSGCVGIPENISAVKDFEVSRYLGRWYEIARLDHSFERGLSHVTATYSLRDDGGLKVVNRGYDGKSDKWKQAEGKAYFVGGRDVGRLKVSFFGPFYGAYNVIALDKEEYRHSLVCGPDRSYLWILARDKVLEPEVLSRLTGLAQNLGFETEQLIFVEHGDMSDFQRPQ
jgi:apolipoprotein D and lipocalin family protein